MPELQPLSAQHEGAVLEFELDNRAYFAGFVPDRGDEYFERFAERHRFLLSEQAAGVAAFYVLVDDDGSVLGRFNLEISGDGVAVLGYRVAERVAGRGVATATVRSLCELAAERHGVHTVRAATTAANVGSQRVLLKAGFVPDGPADPAEIGGQEGSWFRRSTP